MKSDMVAGRLKEDEKDGMGRFSLVDEEEECVSDERLREASPQVYPGGGGGL